MDWFEESAAQPIVTVTRNGEVGRPRYVSTCPRTVELWSSNFPVISLLVQYAKGNFVFFRSANKEV